jgi:hypothetical protein
MTMVTEASSTIRPPKAAYKETPYESPAKLGNGTGAESPFYDTKPAVTGGGGAAAFIKGIEEEPKVGNAALIDAVGKIYAAVTRQIAYHEREAKRLRESLAPFASMSRHNDAPPQSSLEDGIRAVLDYADKLPRNGEQES